MALSLQVESRTRLKKFDWNLALLVLALQVIGLINVYSATHGAGAGTTARFFFQQVAWLSAGWVVYIITTILDYKFLVRMAPIIYGLNLAALVLVEVIGTVGMGAQRWLNLGFFMFQPSETMKVSLILMLAPILSKYSTSEPMGLKELIVPSVILGLPFILVIKQPNLGTALGLAVIASTLMLFVGIRRGLLISALAGAIIATPLVWNYVMHDYQRGRVLTFLDPGRDPRGKGYNSIQSKIAVGSGKILGKGFRKGTQSQLEFLPEQHTDFIFSVLSEEHGFIGSVTTLLLFGALFLLGIRIAKQARDKPGALIVVGVLSMMFFQFTINIGMVMGLAPVVGIPLPLLSYGGSNMLTIMFGLGLLSSVSFRRFLF